MYKVILIAVMALVTMSTRFLVADDDEDIREFISYVLQRAGHEVTTAGNGATRAARGDGRHD